MVTCFDPMLRYSGSTLCWPEPARQASPIVVESKSLQPFRSNISQEVLDDLRNRLANTRWPDQISGQDWQQGTDLSFLRKVCKYWATDFDWRDAENRLNALPQFRAVIEGTGIHLVHVRSKKPDAVPLLLTNGWPSSIFEYLEVIPKLTDAGFHVVAPALPGYGFSDRPKQLGMNGTRIAGLFAGLMAELGYQRFLAHGSDWGALVVNRLRQHHAERLLGIHLSNVHSSYPRPENLSPEEQAFLGQAQGWQFKEGAYAMIQGTKPQTLTYGLNDSPAGLAGWTVEKFSTWSDGDIEQAYGLDGICANLTLYWATETIGSSIQMYAEAFHDPEMQTVPRRGNVPVGVIVFAKDRPRATRAWGERWFNIVHWTDAPRGGHFGAWEDPETFTKDLQDFAALIDQD